MRIASLLLLLCSATAIFAQDTWSGLRFGMSVNEVTQRLSSQGFELGPVEGKPGLFAITPAYTVKVQGVFSTLLFGVELTFGQKGLGLITLKLEDGKSSNGTSAASPLMLASFVPQSLYEALASKYGKPVDREGSCDNSVNSLVAPVALRIVTCRTSWRGDGQQVRLYWRSTYIVVRVEVPAQGKGKPKSETKAEVSFTARVEYEPQSSGL